MPNITPEITLSARNLTRRFGNHLVIHNVSLELKRGEVLGLLGHNGAGKTTTLQMLTGCLLPNSGEIEICGISLLRKPTLAKAHLGYLPETPPLYRELSVNDYLTFAARLRGMESAAVAEALAQTRQRCGLEDVYKRQLNSIGTPHHAVFAQAEVQRVMQVNEAEQGLQQVIAVRPASDDMEEQI